MMQILKKTLWYGLILLALFPQLIHAQQYNPVFWVDEPEDIEKVASKGWQGILYWGATFEDDKMHYYYPSPFLESQSWAVKGEDNLTPLLKVAKSKQIRVMVNMEGVNPYHWSKNKWNAATITATAKDLAKNQIDAVFEECFETNPEVFSALAGTLRQNNIDYISGTDPMLLREYNFKQLWPQTSVINLYNYYLKRDKSYTIATLAQHGSLGLGWAKYWNKKTSMMSPITRDWGIDMRKSPAVVSYLAMIRALQFRLDNFIILGGLDLFDPIANKKWIQEYIDKQEKDRPLMNIVVLLGDQDTEPNSEESAWNKLFNSVDAITTGAFHAGYDIIVSDKILDADAYWIYDAGEGAELPIAVAELFKSDKKVFLQSAGYFPSGETSLQWKEVLSNCGVNTTIPFQYAGKTLTGLQASLPENQDLEIPFTGYYKNQYLRFTGNDIQRGRNFRGGTILPQKAVTGQIYSNPNSTYGQGPYIVGDNHKYLITTQSLHWEVSYAISDLLAGAGTLPSSNVWGIVGSKVSALLAIENTELNLTLPKVKDGTSVHMTIMDSAGKKKADQIVSYKAPLVVQMKEYDFILIDTR